MKPIAWVVTISILLGTSGPTDSHVAQQPSQWHSAMGAMVMSRGELDTSKIVKGWHAHVVYLAEGVKGVTTGVIVEKDPDGITIEFKLHGIRPYVSARKEKDPDIITTKPGPWKRLEIAYDDIDTLVIAENRPTLKRWQKARQAIEKVAVMSREGPRRFEARDGLVRSRGLHVGRYRRRGNWRDYRQRRGSNRDRIQAPGPAGMGVQNGNVWKLRLTISTLSLSLKIGAMWKSGGR